MTKFPKIGLVLSATALVASFTDAGSAIAWGFLKPLSAILFIVFFIAQLLGKEATKYDEEQCLQMARAKVQPSSPVARSPRSSPPRESHNPSQLQTAH